MVIEHRTIWRCDRRDCEATAEGIGEPPPPGWVLLEIRRLNPYGASPIFTFCPEHVAEIEAVLSIDFLRDPPVHRFPGGGLPCDTCGESPGDAFPTCGGRK